MSSDHEDDALSWDGDDALEARRPAPRAPKRTDVAPPTEEAADAGTDDTASAATASAPEVTQASTSDAGDAPTAHTTAEDAEDDYQGIGTVALLMLGIFGGIYLLYTIGWAIGGAGMQAKAMFMLPAPLYVASLWIAMLAPALWFTSTLLLTRGARTWVRFAALLVGALLLVPWPFVVAGGGGVL